ncbi:hypothetical protein NECID01_1312 [Nematocida sp. AWRm77]|nr:hypothetical protein NECID01_1312 [Nematocida sp. AWRm77]
MKTVVVASGKGGVGKSTVAFLLAQTLAEEASVLLLDFDLCGPSVGVLAKDKGEQVFKAQKGLTPLQCAGTRTLWYLSISSLVHREAAVIWRAPKKIALLSMFLESVDAEKYQYVVIDMPPGITDEHAFVCTRVPEALVVMVTTSQNMALQEAEETMALFAKKGVCVLGVVENMSTLCCPNCQAPSYLFSKHGGELLAEEAGVKYLGTLDFVQNIADFQLDRSALSEASPSPSPSTSPTGALSSPERESAERVLALLARIKEEIDGHGPENAQV